MSTGCPGHDASKFLVALHSPFQKGLVPVQENWPSFLDDKTAACFENSREHRQSLFLCSYPNRFKINMLLDQYCAAS
jgi:hypothetical protein